MARVGGAAGRGTVGPDDFGAGAAEGGAEAGGAARAAQGAEEPAARPTERARPSSRPDFAAWRTKRYAMVDDGATIHGSLGRGLTGSVTVKEKDGGFEFLFVRKPAGRPPDAARPLTTREGEKLAAAIEAELRARAESGRSQPSDEGLAYFMMGLRAMGEAERSGGWTERTRNEAADQIIWNLKTGKVADLAHGLHTGLYTSVGEVIPALTRKKALDEVVLALLLLDREYTHVYPQDPSLPYYGEHQRVADLVREHASPRAKELWSKATAAAERRLGGMAADGAARGEQIAVFIERALLDPAYSPEWLHEAGRKLCHGYNDHWSAIHGRPFPSLPSAKPYVAARIDAAIAKLAADGKLEAAVRSLGPHPYGAQNLADLDKLVADLGSAATKQAWRAARG